MLVAYIKKNVKRIRKEDLFASYATVMFGAAGAQIVTILLLPVLTRVYSVEEFGVFGLCVALSNFLRVFFTFRLELAIPNARTKSEASSVVYILAAIGITVLAALYLIIFVFEPGYLDRFGGFSLFVPLMAFVTSTDQLINFWMSRFGLYKLLSVSRLVRAFSIGIFQVVLGLYLNFGEGLLYGYLAGELLTLLFVCVALWRKGNWVVDASTKRMIFVLKKHSHNAFYMFPGHVLNMGITQLPIVVFEQLFGAAAAGVFYMAVRIVSVPGQLVGSVVHKVFTSEAAKDFGRYGECYSITRKTLLASFFVYSVAYCVIDVISIAYIDVILGQEWKSAIKVILIWSAVELVPAVFFTISGVWSVTGSQKLNLKYQVGRAAFVLSALYIGSKFEEFYLMLIVYGIARIISFIAFLLKCVNLSKGREQLHSCSNNA